MEIKYLNAKRKGATLDFTYWYDLQISSYYDDVLDAHNFIDNLEKDWTKYIPEDFKIPVSDTQDRFQRLLIL